MSEVLAAVIPEPHAPVEVRELSEPELEPDSALMEVELSEVCGTDVYLQQGRLAGVPIMADPLRSAAWSQLKLTRYDLGQANEALADVATGKAVKALITPQA